MTGPTTFGLDLESAVLGGLVLAGEIPADVRALLNADLFSPKHKCQIEAILEAIDQYGICSLPAVQEVLSRRGASLDPILDLLTLHEKVPSVAHLLPHIKQLRDRVAGERDSSVGITNFLAEPPVLSMDIEGIRVTGDHGWTGGAPKSMKGLLSLEEARAITTGTPFLGQFATRKCCALYVSEEDRVERLHRRVHSMLANRPPTEVPDPNALRFLVKAGVRLDTKEGIEVLRQHIVRWRPEVVFLEHFDRLHSKSANKAEEMRPLLDLLDQFHTDHGCTFRVQKHHRKEASGQSRRKGEMLAGSVALFGWGESSVYLNLIQRGLVQVEVEAKDGDTASRFQVRYDEGRVVYAGDVQAGTKEAKHEKVMTFLQEKPGVTTADVAALLGVTERTAGTHLRTLEKGELVVGKQESSKHPKHWLVKSGETDV